MRFCIWNFGVHLSTFHWAFLKFKSNHLLIYTIFFFAKINVIFWNLLNIFLFFVHINKIKNYFHENLLNFLNESYNVCFLLKVILLESYFSKGKFWILQAHLKCRWSLLIKKRSHKQILPTRVTFWKNFLERTKNIQL